MISATSYINVLQPYVRRRKKGREKRADLAKHEQFLTLVGGYTGSLYYYYNLCVCFMFIIKLDKQKDLAEKESRLT